MPLIERPSSDPLRVDRNLRRTREERKYMSGENDNRKRIARIHKREMTVNVFGGWLIDKTRYQGKCQASARFRTIP